MSDLCTAHVWTKTAADGAFHPLVCHMLDVAFVAPKLWQQCGRSRWRDRLASAADYTHDKAECVVSFLAGLHDLGKASSPFQAKWPAAPKQFEGQAPRSLGVPAVKGGDRRWV